APHGTLVTAAEQRAGRGRQGRAWTAPAGHALLMSLVLREWPPLVPIIGALAVADVAGPGGSDITIKWPNDVLLGGRKLAGVLGEGRGQEGWAVLGIGINVAVRVQDLPPELHDRAATLGLEPAAIEPMLASLLRALEHRLAQPTPQILDALRARDALRGRRVRWADGEGVACGIDDAGRLLVARARGQAPHVLDAGEVHLLAET
ncbi:MAG TPA: biotin--[acetyl-CoA-carboxylase] ligase, partial [Solirubrobacteraceae bacterium]|nr:biotin--[acetyl-CoA-carboxylase] ligase [Solirubrobacteraceae bacterium]